MQLRRYSSLLPEPNDSHFNLFIQGGSINTTNLIDILEYLRNVLKIKFNILYTCWGQKTKFTSDEEVRKFIDELSYNHVDGSKLPHIL